MNMKKILLCGIMAMLSCLTSMASTADVRSEKGPRSQIGKSVIQKDVGIARKTQKRAEASESTQYTDEQGVVYELDESTKTYSVIGHTDDLKGEIKIASEVKGLPVTSIGEDTFRGCSGLTSVSIPESVTSIGDGAFSGCSGLTSVSIPESVTSIGEFAFSGCSGLTSVSIPESVTSIGDGAFYQCSGLTSVMVESGNLVYDSRNGCNAIIETSSNTLIAGCSSTTIPNSVTSIGERAFSGCRRLTSVTIPESVTSIGDWAFAYCSDLTSITIPNSVTSIGYYAFYNCCGLTSVSVFHEEPISIYYIFSYDTYENATLYVPAGCKQAYAEAVGWKDFEHIEEMNPSVVLDFSMDEKGRDVRIYDLGGRRQKSLRRGLNIVNGRKVMVK